ncbi:MAG: YutD family protein [Hydrogenibacillus sp.]|nr:YutD family protein [Hydrogenibacillus sp.]
MSDIVHLPQGTFELVEDVRGGWNAEAFRARYQDILNKYDYIVGDWGYGQLRLKGFYSDKNKGVPPEMRISALDQYIQEYCNFGCKYFVVRRVRRPPRYGGQSASEKRSGAEKAGAGRMDAADEAPPTIR